MNTIEAIQNAFASRTGGFPHLAEALRQAGVVQNIWDLPGCQSIFITKDDAVVMQNPPLISGMAAVPTFDESALIRALRTDQAGQTTFPEFLEGAWQAGVVRYIVDFNKRTVTYFGVFGEAYVEEYPAAE